MTDATSAKTIYEAPRPAPRPGEVVVTSTCGHNCGGRCVVNAHVRDGRIVRISTDQRRWNPDHPPLPACARGVGQIERTYHPKRLQHPMRRTGPRGSGQFERISWDEAQWRWQWGAAEHGNWKDTALSFVFEQYPTSPQELR